MSVVCIGYQILERQRKYMSEQLFNGTWSPEIQFHMSHQDTWGDCEGCGAHHRQPFKVMDPREFFPDWVPGQGCETYEDEEGPQ